MDTPKPRMKRPAMSCPFTLEDEITAEPKSGRLFNIHKNQSNKRKLTDDNDYCADEHASTATKPISDRAGDPRAGETTDCVLKQIKLTIGDGKSWRL